MKPLEGIFVLDFSQFLSGPYAALRLAELGAQVLKIEKPGDGDLYRLLNISDLCLDGDQPLFHAVNHGKESLAVNLKDSAQREMLENLIKKADVVIFNFRPGVAEHLGLDYETLKAINSKIVYGSISGYGTSGPWKNRPGQDLLVQSMSGLCWLNGNQDQLPLPMSIGITDIAAGEHLTQGILSGLYNRAISNEGCCVEVSLLESALDLQFEGFTAFLNDHELPVRSSINNANAYVAAPYGIYSTKNGYIAIAMTPIPTLCKLLECQELIPYENPEVWSTKRDEIKAILVKHLKMQTTEYWLSILEPADIWCARVMNWDELMQSDGFRVLDILQETITNNQEKVQTIACPIRIDGERYKIHKGAPKINEHNSALLNTIE